mmetsp:Transcript_20463/g.51869  ORF Transcript_20463/g.51869 Transcript_20463/m.51869 type:complete len:285 (-) Transcript_20463:516-1370(-)
MAAWGSQFSSGDQSSDARKAFWANGFKTCVVCGSTVTETKEVAGCRHNGDGYGTDVFTCTNPKCSWSTSFQYDEAGDGPYYYETRGWRLPGQEEPPKPPPPKAPYSTGDQAHAARHRFWDRLGMAACAQCSAPVSRADDVAGKGGQGHEFGTAIFTCTRQGCGWLTSFKYDKAKVPEWVETKDWPRGITALKVTELGVWLLKAGLGHLVEPFHAECIDGETLVRIQDSLGSYPKLKVSQEDGEKLRAAIAAYAHPEPARTAPRQAAAKGPAAAAGSAGARCCPS